MSGSATNYLEQKIGDHLFRTAVFAKPAELWVGLFTALPDEAGENGVEVDGNNYSRVQNDPGDANWYRSTEGENKYWNSKPLEFPVQSAPWGEIIGVGLFDAATGGNLLIAALLDTPRTVDMTTANPVFPPGYLVFPVA